MRIVCDTNVLISAFVFPGGAPEEVVTLARAGEMQHFTSPDILAEFRRVLTAKFGYDPPDAERFVESTLAWSDLVYPTARIELITRKDSDNRILECALAARADYLVTGDRHDILPLRRVENVRIVTPAELLQLNWGTES